MKVVCESCQAKYQVPDERVAGKKLKIRCKRCGATVLIRGDLLEGGGPQNGSTYDRQSSVPAESLAPGLASSIAPMPIETATQDASGYEWHVSLDGDTRGPFNTDELRDWLTNTPGGWDAHVWREGFPDWIDARACAELEPPPAPPAIASLQQEDELPTQTFSSHSSQFLADVAAPQASRAQAIQGSSIRGRSASGISEPGLRDDGFFSSPNLQAMASMGTGGTGASSSGLGSIAASSPAYIPGPNPGFANGEGSGLIDIRALASLARQSTTQIAKTPAVPVATGATGAHAKISETQLSYGSDDDARVALANQPTGFGRLDSLAPVAHTPTSNAALPLAILGGCALVAAAVLAAVLFTRPNRPAEVVSTPVSKEVQDTRAATAQPPNALEPITEPAGDDKAQEAKPDAKDAKPGPGSSAAPVDGMSEDELAAAKKRKQLTPRSAAEDDKNSTSPDDKNKPKQGPGGGKDEKQTQQDSPEVMLADKAKPVKQAPPVSTGLAASPLPGNGTEPSKPEAAPAPSSADPMLAAKPTTVATAQPQKSRSIDDLLNAADKPGAAPAAAAAKPADATGAEGASDLPEAPSRDETLAAMRGVESAVRACAAADQLTGTTEVAITVAGGTGRVTSANVTGIAGNAGSCIARAVRNARFPHFTKPTFSIKYPYRF